MIFTRKKSFGGRQARQIMSLPPLSGQSLAQASQSAIRDSIRNVMQKCDVWTVQTYLQSVKRLVESQADFIEQKIDEQKD